MNNTNIQYYGVQKRGKRYIAKCKKDKIVIWIGTFDTAEEAARAYDKFVIENNLDRRLNFSPPEPEITIPNTRWIILTRKYWTLVDEKNYEWLNSYTWFVMFSHNTYYAARHSQGENGIIFMHSMIMGVVGRESQVDHINRFGWYNLEENLRKCNNAQNQWNRCNPIGATCDYRGVRLRKDTMKYQSNITCNGKTYSIGNSLCPKREAYNYNKKAIELFSEFAELNVIKYNFKLTL